jgi:16S rRNA (cytosine967-C5)-methyltransferase
LLDLCAAPGGKALQLLERLGTQGTLVAADRSEEKLALLRENLARAGSNFTTALVPENPDDLRLGDSFTHILVDAPCSNTGVLARRPEARWRVKRKDIESLSELQSKLLDAALRHLAPGGRIVYATCSIESEENENVIAAAFARHGNLVERDTKLFLPHRSTGDGGFYSLLLHAH